MRQHQPTYTPPSIKDTGTLRPGPEWYPQWMKYRRREDNYVFWQDKFSRCSLDVPGESALVGQVLCASDACMHPAVRA